MIVVENMGKSSAELYKLLLSELKPSWKVEIIVGDYNLYKLGFVDEIPCSLNIDVSEEEISKLHEEILDMEISVYLYEDIMYKNPLDMSEKEKREYREWKKCEKKYDRYAPLESITCWWSHQKD